MKTIFIAFETNIWGGDATYLCTGSSIDECVDMIKENNEGLIKNLIGKQAHIMIDKVSVDEYESDTRVIQTANEDDYNLFIDMDRYIKEIIAELKKNETFLIKIDRDAKNSLVLTAKLEDYSDLSDLQDRLVWSYDAFIDSTDLYGNDKDDDDSTLYITFN